MKRYMVAAGLELVNRVRVVGLAATHWYLGFLVAVLVGLNTLLWGLTLREVGGPEASLRFFFNLFFNRWFILAMLTGFTVAVLSYWVYNEMGVMLGRFFLSISIISIVFVGYFLLKESVTIQQWVGIILIIIGALLIGRI
ncbi:hypothetical protein HRbin02_00726 [Candidatus Calditenuaceae archaeon HR02]|nr:hypothetical protein HRbin02_00726 [Candidatus Calditenuaceae archaeon HR02]